MWLSSSSTHSTHALIRLRHIKMSEFEDEGLVLKSQIFGDRHKRAQILLKGGTVSSAAAFGAMSRKSPFRAGLEPFICGRGVFRESTAGIRFEKWEPIATFPRLRSSYVKICHASLWAEVLISSHGMGEGINSGVYLTTTSLFHLLNSINTDEDASLLSLYFLRHILYAEGFIPSSQRCPNCDHLFLAEEEARMNSSGLLFCLSCARSGKLLGFKERMLLERCETASPLQLLEDQNESFQVKVLGSLQLGVVERHLNRRLKSSRSGISLFKIED